jgi:hypothetical protein
VIFLQRAPGLELIEAIEIDAELMLGEPAKLAFG